jgi:hypothetical protein
MRQSSFSPRSPIRFSTPAVAATLLALAIPRTALASDDDEMEARTRAIGDASDDAPSASDEPRAQRVLRLGSFNLSPILELRSRGEYRRDPVDVGGSTGPGTIIPSSGGFYRPQNRVENAGGVLARTRLGIDASSEFLGARITMQDARIWGAPEASAVLGAQTSLGLYEGYAQVTTSQESTESGEKANRVSFIRLGRQAVTWGDGALLSSADFAPTGRSLDALRGRLVLGDVQFEALGAFLQAARPFGASTNDALALPTPGRQLYAVNAHWRIDQWLELDASGYYRRARTFDTGNSLGGAASGLGALGEIGVASSNGRGLATTARGDLGTVSLAARGSYERFRYGVEGAYQFGNAPLLGQSGETVSAGMFRARVSRTFDEVPWKLTPELAFSYASGGGNQGTYTQFDPMLPSVHRHHGLADAFALSNLVDMAVNVSAEPKEDLRFQIGYRHARLASTDGLWLNAYLNTVGGGARSASLGHELDFAIRYRPLRPLTLDASYSVLVLGNGAADILALSGRSTITGAGQFAVAGSSHTALLQATLSIY